MVNALLPLLPLGLALLHATRDVFPVTVKYSCQEKFNHNLKIKIEIPGLFFGPMYEKNDIDLDGSVHRLITLVSFVE